MARDQIYAMPMSKVGDFVFDEQVVDVFPDMIARSVPGYASILSMIEQLASRYVRSGTHVYDLGCSLGAATRLIARQAPESCVIYAVDNSQAMISRLQSLLQTDTQTKRCRIVLQQDDIRTTEMKHASFAVLNLTLQFIVPEERQALLQRIFDNLLPGGALLLSEKICFTDGAQQELMTDLHHDFKRSHGYSDLEIAQKRTSIENRLIPETMEAHLLRLRTVGFQTIAPWFQCFNFVSILAVKADTTGAEQRGSETCASAAETD